MKELREIIIKVVSSLFRKILTGVFALLLSVGSLFVVNGSESFSPLDAESVKLNFSVIADTHIESSLSDGRTDILVEGLKDMANAQVTSDALVIAGDLTEEGRINEYIELGYVLKQYCKADNMLIEMGNHDIRGPGDMGLYLQTYESSVGKYFEFLNQMNEGIDDTAYFYKIINDCYFIILNTEAIESGQTYISDVQIQWLDDLLEQASMDCNPVFIVNHQPLVDIGDESEKIERTMQKYSDIINIFFITGHYHTPFNKNTITNNGTVYYVDMPSFGKTVRADYPNAGAGFQVELYEDEIIFRARDYVNGKWLSEYDRTIDLINKVNMS
jgi:3',5'-cyclic AMP phosphodiesterase CpdA